MSRKTYECWGCDHVSHSPLESMTHATECKLGAITRPVHCQACAGEIDLRNGPTCPHCGATYPTTQEATT